ncbi:unnamed protein product, partial [Mesorhabditis spiculigera]
MSYWRGLDRLEDHIKLYGDLCGAVSRLAACPDPMCTFPNVTCADGFAKKLNTTSKGYTCQAVNANTNDVPNASFTCDRTETISCPRVPAAGIWSAWTNVAGSTCTATCGNKGTVAQVRTCLTTNIQNCTGISTRTTKCPPQPCPTAPQCILNSPVVHFTVNGQRTDRCGYEIPDQAKPCFPAGCNVPPISSTTVLPTKTSTTTKPTTATSTQLPSTISYGPLTNGVTCGPGFLFEVGQSFNVTSMIDPDSYYGVEGTYQIFFYLVLTSPNRIPDGHGLSSFMPLQLVTGWDGNSAVEYTIGDETQSVNLDVVPGPLVLELTRTAADTVVIAGSYAGWNDTWSMTIPSDFVLRNFQEMSTRPLLYSIPSYSEDFNDSSFCTGDDSTDLAYDTTPN